MSETQPTILLVNGPNMNLLGERQPEIYGTTTLLDVEAQVAAAANERGATVISYQSNYEGGLIDCIHEHRKEADGIIINAGAYSHSSFALRDCLEAVQLPAVEVHISDIFARERFRHRSWLWEVCFEHVVGEGTDGYTRAVGLLLDHLVAEQA